MTSLQLPPDWRLMVLGDFAEVKYGKARPKNSGRIPVIGSGGEYGRTSESLIDFSTIVIGRKGTAGLAWLLEQPCWPCDTTFYLRWKDDPINLHYLYYYLQGKPLSGEHARTTLPSLLKQDLENYSLLVPPLSEQRAIARVLRAVSAAREARLRELALERERKAALMEHLFTHGTRGEPTKMTEIGEMPESWKIAKLGDLLREQLRNGHSASASNTKDGVRTLTLTAVTKNNFSVKNTKITVADRLKVKDLWIEPGDIFIERANTPEFVGLASLYEGQKDFAIFPDLMVRVRLRIDDVDPKFLVEFLLTDRCRNYFRKNAASTTGNMPKIDQGIIEKTQIPLPKDFSEQRQIANIYKSCDAKIVALDYETRLHDELFRAMLEELMSGRLLTRYLIESGSDSSVLNDI